MCGEMVEKIDSPNFKLLFDPGNPPLTDLRIGEGPYEKQKSWDFYTAVKDHISYVHIKDSRLKEEKPDCLFPPSSFYFPGEGGGDVEAIVKDLLANGYDGPFSIEPHMDVVFHEEDNNHTKADALKANYVEYGKRLMALVERCRA